MKKVIIISTALLALASTSALAEGMGHHGGMHQMHKQADVNKDGKVDKNEFMTYATQKAEKKFNNMDVNKDGVLDKQDHLARFNKFDTNHDGNISRKEWEAFHAAMWSKHKGNKHD